MATYHHDPELEALADRVEAWRTQKMHRYEKTPDDIVDEIVRLCKTRPPSRVAKRIRFNNNLVKDYLKEDPDDLEPEMIESIPPIQESFPLRADPPPPGGYSAPRIDLQQTIEDCFKVLAAEQEAAFVNGFTKLFNLVKAACDEATRHMMKELTQMKLEVAANGAGLDILQRRIQELQEQKPREDSTDITVEAPDGSIFKVSAMHSNPELYAVLKQFIAQMHGAKLPTMNGQLVKVEDFQQQ